MDGELTAVGKNSTRDLEHSRKSHCYFINCSLEDAIAWVEANYDNLSLKQLRIPRPPPTIESRFSSYGPGAAYLNTYGDMIMISVAKFMKCKVSKLTAKVKASGCDRGLQRLLVITYTFPLRLHYKVLAVIHHFYVQPFLDQHHAYQRNRFDILSESVLGIVSHLALLEHTPRAVTVFDRVYAWAASAPLIPENVDSLISGYAQGLLAYFVDRWAYVLRVPFAFSLLFTERRQSFATSYCTSSCAIARSMATQMTPLHLPVSTFSASTRIRSSLKP